VSAANRPILSIILPTRNSSYYLKFTINNILNAPDSRFELIVVENSDERNLDLKQFEGDPRLQILKNEKYLSMSENWMKGLKKANGEWFCFVGSDDGIVGDNLSLFLDFLSETECDLVTGHDSSFSYSINNQLPSISAPIFKNTLKITKVKWPIKRVLTFHKLNYDMPQPYNKTFARKNLIQQEYYKLESIPGYSPDISLGYLLALKSKNGYNLDLNLFIRGLSERSNGFNIVNKTQSTESNLFINDTIDLLGPMARKYTMRCRVAIQLDHYLLAKKILGDAVNPFILKCLFVWCEISCENRDHHRLQYHHSLNAFKTHVLDFIAFSLRKLWLFTNFGRNIPSRNRKLTLAENATIIDAADLLKY
jgi:glycosyltransferase involved in cell wall biosynthesis